MKKTKKIISILLSVLMILTGMPNTEQKVMAEDSQLVIITAENYSAYGLTEDYVGYYAIGSKEQLLEFAQLTCSDNKEAKGVLTADIDYSDVKEQRIGSSSKKYGGVFDGNGHTVTVGFDMEKENAALFEYASQATIKNLKVEGTIKTTKKFAAGIVALSYNDTKIENCINSVSISSNINGDGTYGGIVALAYAGTEINNCAFLGSYKDAPETNSNGGIIGWAGESGVSVSNCYVYGEIGTNTENCAIISRGNNKPTVTNCYYTDDYGTVNDGCSKMSREQFESGEVCYKLNNESNNDCTWFQKIGEDKAPVLDKTGENTVYANENCLEEKVYSNTQTAEKHKFEFVKNEDETHSLKCVYCGDVKETHALTLISVDKGNCESKTVSHYHCDTCNKDIDITGDYVHKYKKNKTVKATCTKEGYTLYVCEICNEEKKENIVKAKGHSYREIERKDADCLKNGYIKSKCTVCSAVKTDTIESKGHNFVDGICTLCGEKNTKILVTTYVKDETTGKEESTKKYYDDFTDAIDAAGGTKSTITLQSDINLKNEKYLNFGNSESQITIDFGKYDLVGNNPEFYFFNGGKYVLKGTTGTINALISIEHAEVTIDGGNYYSHGDYTVNVDTNGVLRVKSGNIKGRSYGIYSSGKIIVTGGEIYGGSQAVNISFWGRREASISGGVFKTDRKEGMISINSNEEGILEPGYVAYLLDDNGEKTEKIVSGEYGTVITEKGDIIVDEHESHTYDFEGKCEVCGKYIDSATDSTVAIVTIGDEITACNSLNEAFNKAEGKKATINLEDDTTLKSPIDINDSNSDITLLLNEYTIDGTNEEGTVNYINVNKGRMSIGDSGEFNNITYNNGQTFAEQLKKGYVYYDSDENIIDVRDKDIKTTNGEMYCIDEHDEHSFSKDSSICSVCQIDAEVQITQGNTTYYTSDIDYIINEINNSNEDIKVTFLRDVKTSQELKVNNSNNIEIVFDFGEHTLNCNEFFVNHGEKVAFTGTTGGINTGRGAIVVSDEAKLVIDGGEYTTDSSFNINMYGGSDLDNVIIKSGKFSAKVYGGIINASGTIGNILADGTVLYDAEGNIAADHNFNFEYLLIEGSSYIEAKKHEEHKWSAGRCEVCNLADPQGLSASSVVKIGDKYKYFDKLEDAFKEASGQKAQITLLNNVKVEKDIIVDDANTDITLNFNGFKTDGNDLGSESEEKTNYIWFKAGKLSIKGKAEFNNIKIDNGQILGNLIDKGYVYYDKDGNVIGTHELQDSFTGGNTYIVDLHTEHSFGENGEACSKCMAKPIIKITKEGADSEYFSDFDQAVSMLRNRTAGNITITLLNDINTDKILSIVCPDGRFTFDFSKYTLTCGGVDIYAKKITLNATTGGVRTKNQSFVIEETNEGTFINGGVYVGEKYAALYCDSGAKISSGTFISNGVSGVIESGKTVDSLIDPGSVWTDEEGNVLEGVESKSYTITSEVGKAVKVSVHKEHTYENHRCKICRALDEESANVSVKIGENESYFETLSEAIEFADGKDAYIKILKNYNDLVSENEDGLFSISSGNITIDLGNCDYNLNYGIMINGGNVFLKGEKGSLKSNGAYNSLITVVDGAKVTIEGGNYTSGWSVIYAYNGDVIIKDAKINSETGIFCGNSNIQIYDGTFNCDNRALYLHETNGKVLGGHYKGTVEIYTAEENIMQFSGGSFERIMYQNKEISEAIAKGYVLEDYDGKIIDSKNYYLENVTIKKHIEHINEQGKCKACNIEMDTNPAVSVVTAKDTYCFDSVGKALEAINSDSTLKEAVINVYGDCSEDEKILFNVKGVNIKFNIGENVTLTADKGVEIESGNVTFDVKGTLKTDDSLEHGIIVGKDAKVTLNEGTYKGIKVTEGLLSDILPVGKILVDENENIVAQFGTENVSETSLTVKIKKHTEHDFVENARCTICNIAYTVMVDIEQDDSNTERTYYENFSDAWDYANGKTATITLLSDQDNVEELNGYYNSNIKVNLDKYTLNFKVNNRNSYALNLYDGKYEFNATTGGINSNGYLMYCAGESVQFNINGGRYCGYGGIQLGASGIANIKNAYIESESTRSGAIEIGALSQKFDVTVENTKIVSKYRGIVFYDNSYKGKANLNIKECDITSYYATVISNYDNAEITIDKGNYISEYENAACIELYKGKINILDGEFTGKICSLLYSGGELKLSGGSLNFVEEDGYSIFSSQSDAKVHEFLADEYIFKGNDGSYVYGKDGTLNASVKVVKCTHDFSVMYNDDNTHTYKCSICDWEKVEDCKYTKTTIPPCEGEGYDLYECEICKSAYSDNYIPQKGHDLEYISNDNGTHTAHCRICDKNIETVDCSYGDYHQNTDGKKHSGKCKVCGYVNENLSHNYENYTSLDNGKHSSLCTDCGYENIEDCEYTYEQDKDNLNIHNMTCKKCEYHTSENHEWNVTAKDNVLILGCDRCDYKATASLAIDKSADLTYSGKNIEPANIVYSENWAYSRDLSIGYSDNKKAGEATASVTMDNATAKLKFNISKKQLQVNVTVENKKYDGTTNAVIREASLQDVVDGDKVELVNAEAVFADKHVGKGKSVSFTEFVITGEDADNYVLVQPTGIVADITAISADELKEDVEGFNVDTVKSSDKVKIEDIKDSISESKNATDNEEELEKLNNLEDTCNKLLNKIENVNKELLRVTRAVNSYDKNKVSDKDKVDVEKLIADIDTLLNSKNLTDDERQLLSTARDNGTEILKNCVKHDDNSGNNGNVNNGTPVSAVDSVLRISKLTLKGSKLKVKWNTVSGAEGYDVFVAMNGKKAFSKKPTKAVKGKISCSIKKIGKKKLSAKSAYKVKVKAFKFVNGKKTYIASGDVMSVAGSKNKKYTNAKKVKIKKSKATLTKGKTFKISASIVKQSKKKKLLNGKKKFFYYSGDANVATVNKKGVITAVAPGNAIIYVIAQNGVKKTVNVSVK